ncbi:MAG TPA: sulfite exporter TauE/SafE family protein [Candidatus Limnocylindria bacterium]|nr:sulfite exporter TauE/SafE family protein [Candidatus Limnocylindria bacterium]
MTPPEIIAIVAAGLAAGTINTIVGSGSLITFPMLLALGYAPVAANVTNTVGLVPGSLSGAIGYRRELAGQGHRTLRLGIASTLGGISGAVLLLVLPATSFERVVPFLILGAVALIAFQRRLQRFMAANRGRGGERSVALLLTVYLTGVYGGYFGAAQGVILIALLGIFVGEGLQRLNAVKNVLAFLVNAIAAVLFALVAPVAWPAALLLAIGAIAGGQVGASVGRRLSPSVLRTVIIVVGTVVGLKLLIG